MVNSLIYSVIYEFSLQKNRPFAMETLFSKLHEQRENDNKITNNKLFITNEF